jgi:DNA-binding CsgD family transcriptional regulator
VQGHLASIYGKLAVQSRTEAVTKALKLGWLVLGDA